MDLGSFAYDPTDDEEIRREKAAILLVAGSCSIAGLVWAAMYQAVFGWGLVTALPLGFTVVVGASLVLSHLTRRHHYAVYAQIVCILYVTALIQWNIGGLFDSGFVMAWAFCGPITALIFFPPRRAAIWFALYAVNLGITVAFDDWFSAHGRLVDDGTRTAFVFMNMTVSSFVVFLFAGYFVSSAAAERRRAEALLLNILPKEIAPRLKSNETIADHYDEASVLFADMVGSTPLFAGLEPEEVVDWLNEAFETFDALIARHGVEKIRTIGDNYMVAAGVPTPRKDHAEALVALALDMVDALAEMPPRHGRRMAFRFGIHSGPMMAGVIGTLKFQYDLWGDTVNIAARMESHGEVGRVHVSKATWDLVKHRFEGTPRGCVALKGRGKLETWFVERPGPDAAP